MSEDIQYLFSKMAFFVICLHFHPFADVSFRKQTTLTLFTHRPKWIPAERRASSVNICSFS